MLGGLTLPHHHLIIYILLFTHIPTHIRTIMRHGALPTYVHTGGSYTLVLQSRTVYVCVLWREREREKDFEHFRHDEEEI
jgi:hypothetical protein